LPVIVSPVLLEKVGAGFGNCRKFISSRIGGLEPADPSSVQGKPTCL